MTIQPTASSSPNQLASTKKQLNSDDFIKMMITELQHQDPMQPAKNEEIMAQMSQIGQLQASSQLQDTLKTLALQSQIGAAGNLIGKMVQGLDDNDQTINGVVSSVRVEQNKVYLELESGKTLSMDRVSSISSAPGPAAAPISG